MLFLNKASPPLKRKIYLVISQTQAHFRQFNGTYAIIRAPRGFGDLGRKAIYYQGAGDHW